MAMIEVSCGECGRQFRVRREFIGKSTRCPGCSRQMTIGETAPPPSSTLPEVYDDAPPPPRRPKLPAVEMRSGEWKKTLRAINYEQTAVRFLGIQVLSSFVALCVTTGIRSWGRLPPLIVVIFIIFVFGPALISGIFALLARIAALGVPASTHGRPTATASAFCVLGMMFLSIIFGLGFLMSIDGNRGGDGLMLTTLVAGTLMLFGALVTFGALIAQIGIVLGASSISRGIGNLAVAFMISMIISVVFVGCGSGFSGVFDHNPYGRTYEPFIVIIGLSMLVTVGVSLVMYHSLLSSVKLALKTAPSDTPTISID